jgi:glycosyltransferase involved in cell wall biosynthesis
MPTKEKLVLHLSSVQQGLDSRAFHMESVPGVGRGIRPVLIAAHGIDGYRNGVQLISIRRYKNRIIRILMTPAMIFRILGTRGDIYQFHDPELLFVGLLVKVVFRKKVVYDVCEDYPSMMLTKTCIPSALRPMVAKMVSRLEWLAGSLLDGIVAADPATLRRFAKVGHARKCVFYNFPKIDLFPEPQPQEPRFDIVYRGGLSERAGTLVLLEAVAELIKQNRAVSLLLIGYFDDSHTERIVRGRIHALQSQMTIELRGRLEHQAMASALSEARIGICPLRPIPKFLRNIPVKVWEYWACGLPVIATDLPPIRPFFRTEAGLLVKPDDPQQLVTAILRLLDNPEEAQRMGARGRRAVVERLNNQTQMRGLLTFYGKILNSRISSVLETQVAL